MFKLEEIANNPELKGQVRLIENVVYAAAAGEAQRLDLLTPWQQRYEATRMAPRPLIIFVQGSSWRLPTLGEQIPQLVQFVHQGYVVATVQHRNTLDGHPFPGFLRDVKAAIRFLRAHATQYAIDPGRVAIWGTSSGGNAALLVGLTGNDPAYRNEFSPDQSDAVNAVVACFGPTDVANTFARAKGIPGNHVLQVSLFGPDSNRWAAEAAAMSPLLQIKDGSNYPPFLLMHGDADQVVPFEQMIQMATALDQHGVPVQAVRVRGAHHERDFWSPAIYRRVGEFLAPIEQP